MVKRREDSIKEMNKRKSNEQLTKENRELRAKVADLQTQVEEQADALIELAAMIGGGGLKLWRKSTTGKSRAAT